MDSRKQEFFVSVLKTLYKTRNNVFLRSFAERFDDGFLAVSTITLFSLITLMELETTQNSAQRINCPRDNTKQDNKYNYIL